MKSKIHAAHLAAVLGTAALMMSLPSPALAQGCPELVGRWPYGPANAVAVSAPSPSSRPTTRAFE